MFIESEKIYLGFTDYQGDSDLRKFLLKKVFIKGLL